ncbi:hypothetical protein N7510_008132 [Penicillium lagena]|uniref:uncharacterized protein n=1 Tax=Penicillium lagena TaxID=94218 RepID=UPI002541F477|nr:uncharacterized protein N7510_008132 [Penicillium lagena]KAJ5611413.1 hypothetical protein N7510_008132 [Penicillium lagena]
MYRLLPSLVLAGLAGAQHITNLSDVQWTLSNGVNVTIPGNLPSQAHLDLFDAGIIGDPLYGFNEWNQYWVERSNWTYTSKPISGLEQGHGLESWLVFEGLDTFCEIKLCNHTVANVANQFRKYTFEVTDILPKCSGDPVLSLNFGSAPAIVLEIAATRGPAYVNQANGYDGQEFQGRVYMRKEENDLGWDWSPQFAPAGPWRPAYVVQRARKDPVFITNTAIDIFRQGQMPNLPPDQSKPFVFNASIDFFGTLPHGAEMHLKLVDSTGKTVKETKLSDVYQSSETITGHTIINEDVDLWWPSGYGAQSLYMATVSVTSPEFDKPAVVTKRVGFRTIVLNLEPISEEQTAAGVGPGANWNFQINGHEIYAKGSNFIPPDVFWARVNETKVRQLLELAVAGRQNTLRVWSSGAYLPDWAYDMADEMGLLLWSEFQFSVAYFPTLPDFLAEYEAEVYYNSRRVNHHPSLALWAGGNELEYYIVLYYLDATNPILADYEKIFQEVIIKCVYANTHSISYIPSSTYHGYLSLDFNSTRPQVSRYLNTSGPDALYYDTDFYNYDGSQAFNYSSYPVGRFADEFGFPSMPSVESWRDTIPESAFSLDSTYVRHHNRHLGSGDTFMEQSAAGIEQITDAVKYWYPLPNMKDQVANFTAWIYTTQVFQADYYASQMAFYRRGSGLPNRQLGSLYWQLNDVWVGSTWASIEHSLRQKVVYYAAKDIFSPVIVRPFYDVDTDTLDVWVVSDLWDKASGEVTLKWMDWRGKTLNLDPPAGVDSGYGGSLRLPFDVMPINATRVATYPDVSGLFSNSTPASNALLSLSVKAGDQIHSSYFHLESLNASTIHDPGLTLTVETGSAGHGHGVQFKVTATKAVAAWVWLDYPSTVRGYFDQNGFWLDKDESRTVEFTVWNDFTGTGAWVRDVTVRSIWNNTLNG